MQRSVRDRARARTAGSRNPSPRSSAHRYRAPRPRFAAVVTAADRLRRNRSMHGRRYRAMSTDRRAKRHRRWANGSARTDRHREPVPGGWLRSRRPAERRRANSRNSRRTSSLYHSGAVILQRGYPAVRLQAMVGESGHHRAAHRLGLLYFSPGEYRRAGAGDRTTEGTGGHRAALYVLESRDQGVPLRLDDHIVERVADHVEVVRVAPADEAGEIGGLPDEVRTADVGF